MQIYRLENCLVSGLCLRFWRYDHALTTLLLSIDQRVIITFSFAVVCYVCLSESVWICLLKGFVSWKNCFLWHLGSRSSLVTSGHLWQISRSWLISLRFRMTATWNASGMNWLQLRSGTEHFYRSCEKSNKEKVICYLISIQKHNVLYCLCNFPFSLNSAGNWIS